MTSRSSWQAEIEVCRPDAAAAERLLRTLLPEATREVPRGRASLDRPEPCRVSIRLEAEDSGALRAALNTFLGWISLTERTEAGVGCRGDP